MDGTHPYRTEGHLTLRYRGLEMRLDSDDPRIPFLELLLFGRTLPPPFPAPPDPEPPPSPPPPPARVEVPAAWVQLWRALPEPHRQVLVRLAREPLSSPALEKALKLRPEGLRTINIAISRQAKAVGLALPVKGSGRGRARRRYFVVEEARPFIAELERRWQDVREALDRAQA